MSSPLPAFHRLMLVISACSALLAAPVFAQSGQQPTATSDSAPQRAPAFEVVSIRPAKSGDTWQLTINADEYRARGLPLGHTILIAYFPRSLQKRERLPGAPAWVWNDRFDIVAKVAPEDLKEWKNSQRLGSANPMLQAMLQTALADRCGLRVHRVPATAAGYALELANRGPNRKLLSPATPGEAIPDTALKMPEDGRMIPFQSPDNPVLRFYATSMTSLAAILSGWGVPVEDRTGLTGKYDFGLTRVSNTGDPSVDLDVASLGLKLIAIKIPTENIVIDHIEHPSPN